MRSQNWLQACCVSHCSNLPNFTRKVGPMQVATSDPGTGPTAGQRLFAWGPVSLPGRWFVPRPGFSSLSRWRAVMTAMRLVLADHPLISEPFFGRDLVAKPWPAPACHFM